MDGSFGKEWNIVSIILQVFPVLFRVPVFNFVSIYVKVSRACAWERVVLKQKTL